MGTYQILIRFIHRFQVFRLSGGELTVTYSYMASRHSNGGLYSVPCCRMGV